MCNVIPNIQSNAADTTATYTRRQQLQPKFYFSCEKNTTAMTGTGSNSLAVCLSRIFLTLDTFPTVVSVRFGPFIRQLIFVWT